MFNCGLWIELLRIECTRNILPLFIARELVFQERNTGMILHYYHVILYFITLHPSLSYFYIQDIIALLIILDWDNIHIYYLDS